MAISAIMDVCLQFLDIFMNLNVILSNISYPHLKQHIAIQSLYKGKIKNKLGQSPR